MVVTNNTKRRQGNENYQGISTKIRLHQTSDDKDSDFFRKIKLLKNEIELPVLFEGDEQLMNYYSVITVNPEKHPHIHQDEANRFVEFLMSPNAKKIIKSFGVELYGQALFVPDAKGTNQIH